MTKRRRILPKSDQHVPVDEWRDAVWMADRGEELERTPREIVLGIFQYSSLSPELMQPMCAQLGIDWEQARRWLTGYMEGLQTKHGEKAGHWFITTKLHSHYQKTTVAPTWFNDEDWGTRLNALKPGEYELYMGNRR